MGVRRNFPCGLQRRNFAYPFQVADNAMQIDVHKKLYPFSPLVCAGRTSILNLLSEVFSTLRLSEIIFFHKMPYIQFLEHFLQISHNLKHNQRREQHEW